MEEAATSEVAERATSTACASLPVLPADVLSCIARATLEARGNTVQAWRDLSLVCCAWREALRSEQSAAGSQSCKRLRMKTLFP